MDWKNANLFHNSIFKAFLQEHENLFAGLKSFWWYAQVEEKCITPLSMIRWPYKYLLPINSSV